MTMTVPALLLYIVVAAICGAVGKAIAGDARGGLVVSVFLGLIGAVLGPWIAHQLKLSEPLLITIGGHPVGILWAVIGAAVFVALLHLLSGQRGWQRGWRR